MDYNTQLEEAWMDIAIDIYYGQEPQTTEGDTE